MPVYRTEPLYQVCELNHSALLPFAFTDHLIVKRSTDSKNQVFHSCIEQFDTQTQKT